MNKKNKILSRVVSTCLDFHWKWLLCRTAFPWRNAWFAIRSNIQSLQYIQYNKYWFWLDRHLIKCRSLIWILSIGASCFWGKRTVTKNDLPKIIKGYIVRQKKFLNPSWHTPLRSEVNRPQWCTRKRGWMESDLLNRTESISNTAFWPLEHDLLKDAEKFNALERHLLNGAELCLLLETCRKSMWQCSYITLPPFKGLVPIDLRRAMSKPLGCRMEAYRAVTNQAWAAWAGPWHFPCV